MELFQKVLEAASGYKTYLAALALAVLAAKQAWAGNYDAAWQSALAALVAAGALVPFGGPLGQVAVNKFNDNPADDRMSLSPAVSMLESALGAPASVYKAATSEDGTGKAKATRDVLTAISMATGLPAFAIGRPAGYLAGIADESIEPTSAADMARGLVTGVASPASKVEP